jgi:hypothetical protein
MDSEDYRKAIEGFARERRLRLAQPISGQVEVVGVYPVRAAEPCHLIELMMRGVGPGFDFGSISQPVPGTPSSNWQVPWGEVLLDKDGQEVLASSAELSDRPEQLAGDLRVAFFMHYLDEQRPLKSPFGDICLPKPIARPKRLKAVRYEQPD